MDGWITSRDEGEREGSSGRQAGGHYYFVRTGLTYMCILSCARPSIHPSIKRGERGLSSIAIPYPMHNSCPPSLDSIDRHKCSGGTQRQASGLPDRHTDGQSDGRRSGRQAGIRRTDSVPPINTGLKKMHFCKSGRPHPARESEGNSGLTYGCMYACMHVCVIDTHGRM